MPSSYTQGGTAHLNHLHLCRYYRGLNDCLDRGSSFTVQDTLNRLQNGIGNDLGPDSRCFQSLQYVLQDLHGHFYARRRDPRLCAERYVLEGDVGFWGLRTEVLDGMS